MVFLLGLALRNLARNLRRTLLTGVAVFWGVAVMILGWGVLDGLDDNVLRAAQGALVGDVILRPDGYPDDGLRFPIEDVAPVPDALRARLDAAGPWTSRAAVPARLVKGTDGLRVTVWAYDDAHETQVFTREDWTVEGRWPAVGASEVVLGHNLARLLEAHPGDEIVLSARTRDGAINAMTYTVVGVAQCGNSAIDALGVWMELGAAEQLALLAGARSHLALRSSDAAAAKATLGGLGWAPLTLAEECEDLVALNRIRRRVLTVITGMIMLIAALGIANTVIMATLERIREVGTLLALGMPRAHVRALFLFEGGLMGVVSGALGALLGGGAVLHWQAHGIDVSSIVGAVGGAMPMGAVIYTRFELTHVLLALALGPTLAVLASIWPARFASSIVPADAVRAD